MPSHDEDLLTWELRWAAANGDSDPIRVRYVQCTRALAETIVGGDNPGQDSAADQVDLIMLDGDFVGRMAHPPKGGQLPRGPHLHLLIDHATHHQVGWGLQKALYELDGSDLPVITLKP